MEETRVATTRGSDLILLPHEWFWQEPETGIVVGYFFRPSKLALVKTPCHDFQPQIGYGLHMWG